MCGWGSSPCPNVKRYNHSKAAELDEGCLKGEDAAVADGGAPAPFIAIQPFPALLDLPMGSDAVKASCGSRHTAVVTREWDRPRVERYPISFFSWGLQKTKLCLAHHSLDCAGLSHAPGLKRFSQALE